MKKVFSLKHDKIKPERLVESYVNEVRKYLKRERSKTFPEGFSLWTFKCRFGVSEETSKKIPESEVVKSISGILEKSSESFYLEIIAVPGKKPEKEVKEVKKVEEVEGKWNDEASL